MLPSPLKTSLFPTLLLLCLSQITHAERLPIKSYSVADGLAHNDINKIVRDSRGFLWFCTAGGLSRFDGYTFTNFGPHQGLEPTSITDLLETKSGEYWVATNDGLFRFDPKGSPSSLKTNPMFGRIGRDGPNGSAISITVLMEDHNGTVWCGTRQGLFELVQTSKEFRLRLVDIGIPHDYPRQSEISDLLEDQNGTIWATTSAGLYRRWPDGHAARYTKRDGLPNDFLSNLFKDHQGNLWVSSLLGGFFNLLIDASDTPPLVGVHYSMADGLPTNWVNQISQTSDGRLWVGTSTGLVEFSPNASERARRFHSYSIRNGLSYQEVTALGEDIGGNLWLGTNTAGAMKLSRGGFVTYDERDALVTVSAIFEDRRGHVCFKGNVPGDDRFSVFEGAKLELLSKTPPISYQRFGCLDGERFNWFKPKAFGYLGWVMEGVTRQTRNGEWWLGAGTSLYRFPANDSFESIKDATPLSVYPMEGGNDPEVFRLFEDSRANMWISVLSATTTKLLRWERTTETMHDLSALPGLASSEENLARSFGEDRSGNIWIGFSNGVARYSKGELKFFPPTQGLPSGAVMNIFLDQNGRLWLASARNGLVRIDDPSAERPAFINYTTAQGLSSNNTEVIVDDLKGNIYVGGGQGLDLLDPSTGGIKHFTTVDGLASGLLRAAFRDRNGVLWFGTTSGLSKLMPTEPAHTPPATVLISGLRIGGVPRLVSALGETEMSLQDLAANENQIQLDFMAISFVAGEVLRYQYKLEGADAEWSAPSELRTVNFANLAPGRYTFQVRALNSDGSTSPRPATVTFRILRPIWQRWWFLMLAFLLLSLIAYAWYRSRVNRLLGIERVRTRIAADLHDDIGTNLTRIAILSEVARSQLSETNSNVANPISSIARISRESVASMSDIVWAINPKRDSLLDLVLRMRRFANEISAGRQIEFRFRAPETDQDHKIGADLRRDVFLIFKEALSNAVRHSNGAKVEIELQVDRQSLELKIADDGCGFDSTNVCEGHGLISMQRRATALGGELQVISVGGVGTKMMLKVPR